MWLLCQRICKSLSALLRRVPVSSLETAVDVGTCAISLADIGCDIAVAVEFWQGGYTLFLALVDHHAFQRAAPAWDLPGANPTPNP